MSALLPLFVDTWRIEGWTCTLSVPQAARQGKRLEAAVEWSPKAPDTLTDGQLKAYREGRDAALERFAAKFGGHILVIEP